MHKYSGDHLAVRLRLYAFGYRTSMRVLHRFNRHWHKRCGPDNNQLWCHWCGDRRSVKVASRSGE